MDFERIEETAKRDCLKWWLNCITLDQCKWWPIQQVPVQGDLSGEEWSKVFAWNTQLIDYLIPLGLLRCRSLVQLSYASEYPHTIRCVADWSGDDWKFSVCERLFSDKHWPTSWPNDLQAIAFCREDWHISLPTYCRTIADLVKLIQAVALDEQVDQLPSICAASAVREWRAKIEGVSFTDGQWFGTPEQDLRTDVVGELIYPFGSQRAHTDREEVGPFQLQWLKWIFEADHDNTLKDRLGDALRGSGREWYVCSQRMKGCPTWKGILQSKADDQNISKRTRSQIKTFLSLQ